MSYASKAGRANTSTTNPQAFGVCDRCGLWYNLQRLSFQRDWRGAALQNLYIRVCCECLDVPQPQLRSIVVPADPIPVWQPRTEPFFTDETGNNPAIGLPVGLDQNAITPFNGANLTAYGVPLSLLSVTASGSTTISVTCRTAHGLATNDQISVEGLSANGANGFYSVIVTSAMAFTYTTLNAIPAAALLTPTTRMVTALVGLPLGVTTIPQVAS